LTWMLEDGVQIELMVARYLTSRPGREQARPARCSQGFSAPHCERLARNITDVGQVRVPCRDRRQGASRIQRGSRNMFLVHLFLECPQTVLVCGSENTAAACRVSRFERLQVPASRMHAIKTGQRPRIAVDATRDEAIAPRRPMWSTPRLLRRTSTITVA
jgi:hypothetical protein